MGPRKGEVHGRKERKGEKRKGERWERKMGTKNKEEAWGEKWEGKKAEVRGRKSEGN